MMETKVYTCTCIILYNPTLSSAHLAVVTPGSNQLPIRRVDQRVHVIEVSLLFENVGL